jgi:hypothetical protein
MDDKIIKNPELEKTLEDRQQAKAAMSEFKKLDRDAKQQIRSCEEVPPFRVGRFLITQTNTPPRSVSFEAEGGTRLNIKLAGEE